MPKYLDDFLASEKYLPQMNKVKRKKHLQKLKIIKHLFLNGENTHAEIRSRFKISFPTSSSLLNELMEERIIKRTGLGISEGGRRPDLYGLNNHSFFVLSIHIEPFSIKFAIIDNNLSIYKECIVYKEILHDHKVLDLLYRSALKLIKLSNLRRNQVVGVGISMPGLVSVKEGKNWTYNLAEQNPESLRNKFEKRFKIPVMILNDAKSACLAEFRLGKARKKNSVLVISMDWGIGLGIILGQKIHSGHSGLAGEFGHIPMTENGLLCHCGKRGCLETEASGIALVRRTKEGLINGQTSILNNLKEDEIKKLKPETIINAANTGDQFAINMLLETGKKLGKGIAILIQIFNPELIILEGKFADAKQFILPPAQETMNKYIMLQLRERTKIEVSDLGPNSSLIGSAFAAMDAIFNKVDKLEFHLNK